MGKNYNISIKITNLNEAYLFPYHKTKHLVQHQLLLIDLNVIFDTVHSNLFFIHKFPENGPFPTIRHNGM